MKIVFRKTCLFFICSFSLSASFVGGECASTFFESRQPPAFSQAQAPIARLHFGPGPDDAGTMKSQASLPPHLHSRTHGSSPAKGRSLSKIANSKSANFRAERAVKKQTNKSAPVSSHQLTSFRKGSGKK